MLQDEFNVLSRDDLEQLKFVLDSNWDVAIRILLSWWWVTTFLWLSDTESPYSWAWNILQINATNNWVEYWLTVETAVPVWALFTDTTYSVWNGWLTEINFTSALDTILSNQSWINTWDQDLSGYQLISEKWVANWYVPLGSDSKISNTYIPDLSISEYIWDFLDLATALANASVQTSQRWDWFTVQTDWGLTYIVISDSPTIAWDVKQLATPTWAVSSVSWKTWIVTLDSSDVWLWNVENTALSTWAWSSNITTLWTIASWTWNWTALNLSWSYITWNLPIANLGSWTWATSSTFWRWDGTWASIVAGNSFADNTFNIFNNVDITKIIDLDLSSITTWNTRTYIMPDKNGTIALLDDVSTWALASWGSWTTYSLLNIVSEQWGLYTSKVNSNLNNSPSIPSSITEDSALYKKVSTLNVTDIENSLFSIVISSDWLHLYGIWNGSDSFFQYDLAIAYDLSTAEYIASFSYSAQSLNVQQVTISTDWTEIYFVDITSDDVFQYTMSTAYDITTCSFTWQYAITEDSIPTWITFWDNWTKMYIAWTATDVIYQYTLSTPWLVSSASYSSKSKLVSAQDTTPNSIAISWDWEYMYMWWSTSDSIHQYKLSTLWDISTAVVTWFLLPVAEWWYLSISNWDNISNIYNLYRSTDDIYQYQFTNSNWKKISI